MTRKRFFVKLTLIFAAFLLLSAISSCDMQPSNGKKSEETGSVEQTDTQKTQEPVAEISFDMPSEELMQELEATWREKFGYDVLWNGDGDVCYLGERYYGSSGGYVFVFDLGRARSDGQAWQEETKSYAGYTFAANCPFALWVYCDGVISPFGDLVDSGLITPEAVSGIASYHADFEASKVARDGELTETVKISLSAPEPLESDVAETVRTAWLEDSGRALPEWDGEDQSFGAECKYYGTYNGCVVFALPGDTAR